MSEVGQRNPATEDWIASFGSRAQQSLRLFSIAASTNSDREAFRLLTTEFNNMNQLNDRFLEANGIRTYVPSNALDTSSGFEVRATFQLTNSAFQPRNIATRQKRFENFPRT